MSAADPLLTYDGIAKFAKVKRGTVYAWKKRNILPAPSRTMNGHRPLWRTSTIRNWLETTGRLTHEETPNT